MIDAQRFTFLANALNGTGGFSDGGYLVKYPRESDEKFNRRKEIAWYRNFLNSACVDFTGYLSKRPPARNNNNPLMAVIIDDADGKGNSLDVFWQGFMIQAKARGSMLLLIDMPKQLPVDQASQINQRITPYLAAIAPENVMQISIGSDGLVETIEIADTYEDKPAIRGWDTQSWWVRRGETVLDSGEHGLSVCPVLLFAESGDFPCVGAFAQIADLSKRHYNLCSERDEILRAQTFSLLTYQVPSDQAHLFEAKKVAEAIGTHNMLIHNGAPPGFIAPPDGPATIYSQVISDIETAIKQIALTVEQPNHQESGIALTLRFQQLNSALTAFARAMEDLERRVWWVVSRWLQTSYVPETAWSKDYSLADVTQELSELQQMQASGFPVLAIDEKQKLIIQLMLSNLNPESLENVLNTVGGEHSAPLLETTLETSDGVDLSAIEGRLDAIDASIKLNASTPQTAPVINISVPEQPPAQLNMSAPIINVTVPEQPPAQITVEAPVVNVTLPENPQAVNQPQQPVVINTGSNGKIIDLVRDASGAVTGASVRETHVMEG
ncbi:MAG: hypothetical protein KGZ88_11840 [Methylomicrobium sp.]|nr:hypothetical protein [Methylomicrobium sp.]